MLLVIAEAAVAITQQAMQCFCFQGQPYLALRQYHQCVESLKTELQVDPSVITTELYKKIRSQQDLQAS